jgi:hypothetical protein
MSDVWLAGGERACAAPGYRMGYSGSRDGGGGRLLERGRGEGDRCPGYDRGEGRRRLRHLNRGTLQSFIEAAKPRARCPEHGVVVAWVSWARHGAGHTRACDDTAVAVSADREGGGDATAPGGLANCGPDRHAGDGGGGGGAGSLCRTAPDRDRRDQPQAGASAISPWSSTMTGSADLARGRPQ